MPCLAGRRKFGDFLAQYAAPMAGTYTDVDTGATLGECGNMAAVTYGQRASIGGNSDRCFAVPQMRDRETKSHPHSLLRHYRGRSQISRPALCGCAGCLWRGRTSRGGRCFWPWGSSIQHSAPTRPSCTVRTGWLGTRLRHCAQMASSTAATWPGEAAAMLAELSRSQQHRCHGLLLHLATGMALQVSAGSAGVHSGGDSGFWRGRAEQVHPAAGCRLSSRCAQHSAGELSLNAWRQP